MNIGQITSGQVATSVWANAARALTDYGIPTTSENTGGFVNMTCGNGVKGAYAQLIATTAAQVKRLAVQLSGGTAVVHLVDIRSEEHTSELQSQSNLVCRLLLEKKKKSNMQVRVKKSNGDIKTVKVDGVDTS